MRRRFLSRAPLALLVGLFLLPIPGWSQAGTTVPPVVFEGPRSLQQLSGDLQSLVRHKKTLIAYYSRTGFTEQVARWIQTSVGGDLVRLETAQPYPGNYRAMVEKNVEEQRAGAKPPLKTRIADFPTYEVIFVGYPIWNMDLPRPLATFLSSYDFAGKTIIPFCTNGGYGPGGSQATIEGLCPRSKVLDVLAFRGNLVRMDTK